MFWGKTWDTDPYGVRPKLKALFAALRGSAYNNILTQYGDAGPIHNDVLLMNTWIDDTTPVPAQLHETAVEDEVAHMISTHGGPTNGDTQYILFPDATGAPWSGAPCGQHLQIGMNTGNTAWAYVLFPSSTWCNHGTDLASAVAVTTTHEYAEAATDPTGPGFVLPPGSTWGWTTIDPRDDPIEVADQCQGYDGGDLFSEAHLPTVVPLLWSQNISKCLGMRGQDYPTPDSGYAVHTVQGAILDHYRLIGETSSSIGEPRSEEQPIANGHVSYFVGTSCGGANYGEIYDTPATGAHEVEGCIDRKYQGGIPDKPGGAGPTSAFGFPTSDMVSGSGGKFNLFAGTTCTSGAYQGSGSGIFDSNAQHIEYEVHGCIYQLYVNGIPDAPGGAGATSGFGYPTSDETPVTGGAFNTFAGTNCTSGSNQGSGSGIFWNSALGSPFEVHGCVYRKYVSANVGGVSGIGLPTSNETKVTGGAYNNFGGTGCGSGPYQGSGAGVYWNSAKANAYEVQGCVYQAYRQHMGGPTGTLGLPTGDETPVTNGAYNTFAGTNCTVGPFQGSGSAIYWNRSQLAPYEVQGCIYRLYTQYMGGPTGALGLPTSDEHGVTSGFSGATARSNSFANGAVYWGSTSSSNGGFEVQGDIWHTYVADAGPGGRIGLPVSNEYSYDTAGDRESDFENATILWNKATHQTTLYLYS